MGTPLGIFRRQTQTLGIYTHGLEGFTLGLFPEFLDAALPIGAHQAE